MTRGQSYWLPPKINIILANTYGVPPCVRHWAELSTNMYIV